MISTEQQPKNQCGYCGAPLVSTNIEGYRQCPACGSLNLRPLPVQEDNTYFEEERAIARMDETDQQRRAFLRQRLESLAKAEKLPRTALLDIGCATGRVMELTKEMGWTPTGIELSPSLAKAAEELLPESTIIAKDFMEINDLPENFYPSIVALDVIEHVLDPLSFAQKIATLCPRDGAVLLHTPNANGLRARLQREHWNMRIPQYHYHLATPKGLDLLARRSGFDTVSQCTTSGSGLEKGLRRTASSLKDAALKAFTLGNGLEVVWRKK